MPVIVADSQNKEDRGLDLHFGGRLLHPLLHLECRRESLVKHRISDYWMSCARACIEVVRCGRLSIKGIQGGVRLSAQNKKCTKSNPHTCFLWPTTFGSRPIRKNKTAKFALGGL